MLLELYSLSTINGSYGDTCHVKSIQNNVCHTPNAYQNVDLASLSQAPWLMKSKACFMHVLCKCITHMNRTKQNVWAQYGKKNEKRSKGRRSSGNNSRNNNNNNTTQHTRDQHTWTLLVNRNHVHTFDRASARNIVLYADQYTRCVHTNAHISMRLRCCVYVCGAYLLV